MNFAIWESTGIEWSLIQYDQCFGLNVDLANPCDPEWISNYIHNIVLDEITYPFKNVNSAEFTGDRWIPRAKGQYRGK